jgi:hypothetical protein
MQDAGLEAATQTSLLSAAGISVGDALFGPLFDALNPATDVLTRVVVWANFRVAVALFVIAPLALFFWSFAKGGTEDAVKRVLIGYWQASSLLMLTVFLNIANLPSAAFTGLFVQCMIPVSLMWWDDLMQEIRKEDTPLARAFLLWRLPAIIASVAGVAVQLPFQSCNFVSNPVDNPMCAAWLEPPHAFHDIFLKGVPPSTLQSLAFGGCTIYFAYLFYLGAVVVPRVGRSGRKDRNIFSSVSALKLLGWIDRESTGN